MTQTLPEETAMGRLARDYIACSFLWNGTTKDTLILMGLPVFETPKEKKKKGPDGFPIEIGVIEHWENEVDGLKNDPDALNELYRQFPRTEKHASEMKQNNLYLILTKIFMNK